jgi:hypothetical protein
MTTPSGDDASARPASGGGSRWPAGPSQHPHADLPVHLLKSGRAHARRALSTYTATTTEEQQLAAISVGSAVELLSKALVADVNPALLSERGDRDTMLHLTNLGHLSRKAATEVRSLSAVEAVAAANHIHPSLGWRQGADSIVFRVRNAAAHMALVDAEELHAAVLELLKFVRGLLTVRGGEPSDFWGEPLAPLAAELLDEASSASRRSAIAKQAAAHARLESIVGSLGGRAREVVLAALSGRRMSSTDHEEPETCPVCGQQGWLLCGVERGPVEWDPDGARVPLTAWPFGFECPVCGLDLEGDELLLFTFPQEIELEPDDDPVEAYEWEPDEDVWRGR